MIEEKPSSPPKNISTTKSTPTPDRRKLSTSSSYATKRAQMVSPPPATPRPNFRQVI
jgi:hypothetical protein